MQQAHTSSPAASAASAATRVWWTEISTPARVAFVCGFPIAFGLIICEAVFDDSLGPEHPLPIGRLALRLGCFFACGLIFAIAGIGQFRAWRATTRLREGLCLRCGYDLRAHTGGDRCPECGWPLAPVAPSS